MRNMLAEEDEEGALPTAPTWSYSLPASSRLCWMANCSKSSSSSRRASWWVPTTLYPRGTSKSAGSISHARQDAAGRQVWLGNQRPCAPHPPHALAPPCTQGAGAADTGGIAAGRGGLTAGAVAQGADGLIAPIEVPKGDAGIEDVEDGDFCPY